MAKNKGKIALLVGGIAFTGLLMTGGKPKGVSEAAGLFKKYRGIKEDSAAFKGVLKKMWRHVGYSDSSADRAIRNETPWSAAFISYAFRNYADFPKSASHSYYIVDSRTNTENRTGKFRLRRINKYRPKVGDIVCRGRGGVRLTYDSIYKGAISHCDIVVAIKDGYLITIGGNVSNQISITKVPIQQGYINKSGYFAVIQNLH